MKSSASRIAGHFLDILDDASDQKSRKALAAEAGADEVVLFLTDPELGIDLPAPGFGLRLNHAAQWRELIRLAIANGGRCEGKLPFPEQNDRMDAIVLAVPEGTALILLGGTPTEAVCAEIAEWLPWVSRLFAKENALKLANAEKAMALSDVTTSNRMAATLEGMRRSLEAALRNAEQEQVNAKREQEERRKFFALVENSGEFISMSDLEGRAFYLNPYGRMLVGHPDAGESLGMKIEEFLAEEFRNPFLEVAMPALMESGHWEGEVLFRHGDSDRTFPVLQSLFLVREPDTNAPICIANVVRDMTERKRAEDILKKTESQLQQAQKMESIGKLAGGIAHDFNNLLTAINGYTDLSLSMLESDHFLYSNLKEVRGAGERAASLTSQLLAYSRKQVLAPKIVDLNDLVTNMHNMLSRIIGEDVALTLSLKPKLEKVKVDVNQIEQAVLNLVVNARDALSEGGQITIETDNVLLDSGVVALQPDIIPGKYVLLAVSDNGCGMNAEVLARIFEPFFTTKKFGKGSGMGLSMVQGIIKQTGGHISAYSEPGTGSVFKIYLPITESGIRKEGVVDSPLVERGYRGKETILLAEDEEAVRKLTRGILELQGYTVLESANGVEAVSVGGNHKGKIHLLLTDVIMPRKNGKELAQYIKQTRPDAKVIFMSGYTDDAIVRHGLLDANSAFLQKPFSPKNLVKVVREVLDLEV